MPYIFKYEIPSNSHPLVKFLFEEMERQNISTTALADKSFVSRHTISSWRQRVKPDLNSLECCLNALGYDLLAVRRK